MHSHMAEEWYENHVEYSSSVWHKGITKLLILARLKSLVFKLIYEFKPKTKEGGEGTRFREKMLNSELILILHALIETQIHTPALMTDTSS